MAGFLKRLLRIGKLPAETRTQAEAEGIIHLTDCIGVWARFTGQIPGRRSVGLTRGYGGALVLTNQRVLATVGAVPGQSGRAVDLPWTAHQSGAVRGMLSEDGLVLDIADLSRVDPQFSGTLSLTFKTELTADQLTRLPSRTFAFDVPPSFVYRILGVPR
ncbi:hypothetical protein ACAG24_011770 [Mycobacterium sp. pW049]|uniref:hypothetical protein n=1 Tax=[Mycobacterium] bulgaricum TaxID=3238985 RepID=UPI00351B07B4